MLKWMLFWTLVNNCLYRVKTLEYEIDSIIFELLNVIRSTLIPSVCKSELVWPSYSFRKITVIFLWNVFCTKFYNAFYWVFYYAPLCWVFANRVTNMKFGVWIVWMEKWASIRTVWTKPIYHKLNAWFIYVRNS